MSEPRGQDTAASTIQHGAIVDRANPTHVQRDAVTQNPLEASEESRHDESQGLQGLGIESETPSEGPKDASGTGGGSAKGYGAGENKIQGDSEDVTRLRDIQRQASEHLARRAAEMTSESDGPRDEQSHAEKGDLPASPPPPAPPRKDTIPRSELNSTGQGLKETQAPAVVESTPNADSDLPQGLAEATGVEIQNIMEQFESGAGGPGEEEIMSPRLERQSLILPVRTSSLEHRDGSNMSPLSPQATGQSFRSMASHPSKQLSPEKSREGKTDDTASIASTTAGSIFQPPPPNPDPEPALPFDFHRFLEQLRHRTADPVARYLPSFLGEFAKKQWMVHEQVKIISDFLDFITKKMAQCEVWRTVSDAEFDNAREGMEKLVMNRLYSQTFSAAIPPAISSPRKGGKGRSQVDAANPHGPGRRGQHQEDVERDEVIVQKMRIYGWIQEEHLDIKTIGEKGRKFITMAQQELLKINTYRAPRDKVICVLNCCKVIFGFLKNSKSDQSADAFVPLLIYTVLQAKPEHLNSNVQYIWRFRNQDKLGGEAGYYMSSLTGVVTFIENLDRTTLTISDEDFERNVEQAVSAIAERDKYDEYEKKAHTPSMPGFSEKSSLSRAEVTPRNSLDWEKSSPRRNVAHQRLSEKNATTASTAQHSSSTYTDEDDSDAVAGLLKTIKKPLNTIGRMFSDEASSSQQQQQHQQLRPLGNPVSMPRRLSPAPNSEHDGRVAKGRSPQRTALGEAAARQASAEAAEAQRVRAREYKVVVETLQSMFPNLDKDVIQDVVAAQAGNVGRAVDACLAVSGGGS